MAAAVEQHIRLAQSLPPRLLTLFRRFPPPQLRVAAIPTSSRLPSEPATIEVAESTSPSDPNATTTTEIPLDQPHDTLSTNEKHKNNPFLPFKNPRTGHWHPPHYSLRRQAELYRLAEDHHVLPLMPLSPKHPEIKEEKRLERALKAHSRISEGLLPISGKKAKGKLWERTLRGKMDERRRAMEGMPEMIRAWKQRGHGRGWKKWPK